MKLSEIKSHLASITEVTFVLPNGQVVPQHFHVTEVGKVEKHFIDCGGTTRKETAINFQLFTADDYDHRLSASKLSSIIMLSEAELNLPDAEIEVEYQAETIGKYHLRFAAGRFHLQPTQTDCLAKDKCGIPAAKPKIKLAELQKANTCSPGSGCC
jgi:hypothetical protein